MQGELDFVLVVTILFSLQPYFKMLLIQISCILLCLDLIQAEDILITIPDGQIRGRKEYPMREVGVQFYAFQQIPYGKPPVGDLRFKEPQPAEPWEGVLDVTSNTKVCYQISSGFNVPENFQTEDCLYLNVYTPKYPPSEDSLLPVMFWIYGGGFLNGGATFDMAGPHYFMENNVIIVTIGYRVGPFGFLSTNDLEIPGNYGLKDQNLALQWVKNNIKYFGGDPDKVTIFGTSAGAASVTYHYLSPKSNGLFWAGIASSGSLIVPWAYQRDSKNIAYKVATVLNSDFDPNASTQELVEYLRSVPAKDLNEAAGKAIYDWVGEEEIIQGFYYAPVIEPEHENALITESMYPAVDEGRMNRVPLMIGIESEEALYRTQDANWVQTLPYYDNDVKLLVNHNMGITDSDTLTEVGQKIRDIVTDGLLQNDLAAALRYYSDMSFNRAIIHHAELQSKYSDVYFYQFSYDGQLGGTTKVYVEGADRVQHSEDINYYWVYGNWSNLDYYPPADVLTSERWRLLLTNFAKYKNPTPDEYDETLQNIKWPKVDPYNFQYMNVNVSLSIEQNPKSRTYSKWLELYEEYAQKPYINF